MHLSPSWQYSAHWEFGTNSVQLRERKNGPLVPKRHQMKHLDFLIFLLESRHSMSLGKKALSKDVGSIPTAPTKSPNDSIGLVHRIPEKRSIKAQPWTEIGPRLCGVNPLDGTNYLDTVSPS